MQHRSLKGFNTASQLAILLACLALGLVLAGLSQQLVLSQLSLPVDVMSSSDQLMTELLRPENASYARMMNMVGTFCIMFIPAVLFTIIVQGPNFFWLGFNTYLNYRQFIYGTALIFFANLVTVPLTDLSKWIVSYWPSLNESAKAMEKSYLDQVKAFAGSFTLGDFISALLFMALLPAIFEEIFFRGALQNTLERWTHKPIFAIFISALIFSLIHNSVYLFLGRFVMGFVLGLIFYKTRNLWVCIFVHFINNAVAAGQLFQYQRSGQNIPIDEMDPSVPWWSWIPIIILIALAYYLLDKYSKTTRQKIIEAEQRLLKKIEENKINPIRRDLEQSDF